jgi:two-component system sensor histidine kinase ChvG
MSNAPLYSSPDDTLRIAPRPLSRLTYKILSLNVITIAVVAMSFSYLAQTRENLISNEIDNFETETRLYAAALKKTIAYDGESNLGKTLSELNFHTDQQAMLFDERGKFLAANGLVPLRRSYAETQDKDLSPINRGIMEIEDMLSVDFKLPPFPGAENLLNSSVPKIQQTVDGLNIAAWSAQDGGLVLSADIHLHLNEKRMATLQLVRRDLQIEETFAETRIDVLRFAVISLVLTVSLSLYLAGLIGHPLRNLAMAAESFRLNRGRGVVIPDMSDRNDEIGELSKAMREMAAALQNRLDAIERFAADVAHELKNPLTSMKSAVETLPKVRKEEDRTQLTEIIHHDLQRMDRLISDISQASRLDAELSRDTLEPLDIRHILNPLIDAKLDPMHRIAQESGQIRRSGFEKPVLVMGQDGRLAQVFDNLISNALSFSPIGAVVTIGIESNEDRAKITVDDEGIGIPESRLEKIFDRFYSERPVTENFGMHSGLGLSIAKQIVESHGGTIHAENRKDEKGNIIGARFVVRLRVPV